MTDTKYTQVVESKLHPAQTHEAARDAWRLLVAPQPPIVAEEDSETEYIEFGAGLALSIASDGRFIIGDMTDARRTVIVFTPKETKAIYHFWWSIIAPGVLESLPAAMAHVKAQRTQEASNEGE